MVCKLEINKDIGSLKEVLNSEYFLIKINILGCIYYILLNLYYFII
jgi:hypothetical protein